jgi:hypothetical protein
MKLPPAAVVGVAALVIGLLVGAAGYGHFNPQEDPSLTTARQASPDTPPAEFAYLDSSRVLAYLGQISGGLAATQNRTSSAKFTTKASVTAKDVAAVEAASEQVRGSSETVTLTEADRFYTLLRILRKSQGSNAFATLKDVDAVLTKENRVEDVVETLEQLHEGDFVRIRNARAFVPTYAAVLFRARFASYYLGGDLQPPAQELYSPPSPKARLAVRKYQKALKTDPRIPMVVPTLGDRPDDRAPVVTFFVPARYRGLSSEASLLGGNLTIVGKVVYKDPRLPGQSSDGTGRPTSYLDRQTLTTFVPALQTAEASLLERLNLKEGQISDQIKRSLTIAAPVAVVIPVAIYQ